MFLNLFVNILIIIINLMIVSEIKKKREKKNLVYLWWRFGDIVE